MLKVRVIPCILVRNFGVVKTIEFSNYRPLGVAVNFARVYNSREVDELIVLDIDASKENRGPDLETVYDIAEECYMPLTIGGGIKTLEDIREILKAGADKVSLNASLFTNIELVREGARRFGKQCIVASIDAKKINEDYFVYDHIKKEATSILIKDWVVKLEKLGAGEIYLNSVDQDGKMSGYDINLYKLITKIVNIPIIASGGAGKLTDFIEVVKQSDVNAVSAASIFHYTQTTPMDIKKELQKNGINSRVF